MKKSIGILMAVVAAGSMSASATLIAGWETWKWQGAGTDPLISGATVENGATASATQSGAWSIGTNIGSIDGTFGSLASPAAETANSGSTDGYNLSNGADGFVDFSVTATGSDTQLTTFHFDATRFRSGSAENWTLEVLAGGDINNGAAVTVASGTMAIYNSDFNLPDFDVDLTTLADNDLGAGGTATFRLSFAGGNGSSGQNTYLDNVGISAVPEPATLGLVALFGGGLLFIRRRFMI